jgi:protein-tyrosine phosphatase
VSAPSITIQRPTRPVEAPRPRRRARHRLLRLVGRGVLAIVAVVAVGNALIAGLSLLIGTVRPPAAVPAQVDGVDNLTSVTPRLWRGGAPGPDGYESLRAAGVTTIVDLRAEPDAAARDAQIESLGMRVVHLPIRDGQTPTDAQVAEFAREVGDTDEGGLVFVHCGAGVGRTGSIVAAYLVRSGQATGLQAVAANLGVGPPSLEQIAFAAGLDREAAGSERPSLPVVLLSRLLDAPRRLLSHL